MIQPGEITILSISRVFPTHAAIASTVGPVIMSTCFKRDRIDRGDVIDAHGDSAELADVQDRVLHAGDEPIRAAFAFLGLAVGEHQRP